MARRGGVTADRRRSAVGSVRRIADMAHLIAATISMAVDTAQWAAAANSAE
jgi:hypothetical protein